jgi:hypothetical protein
MTFFCVEDWGSVAGGCQSDWDTGLAWVRSCKGVPRGWGLPLYSFWRWQCWIWFSRGNLEVAVGGRFGPGAGSISVLAASFEVGQLALVGHSGAQGRRSWRRRGRSLVPRNCPGRYWRMGGPPSYFVDWQSQGCLGQL